MNLKKSNFQKILVAEPFPLPQIKPSGGRPLYERDKNESALVGVCPTYIPFPPTPAVTSEAPWRLQSSLKTILLTKKATEHMAYFILIS